MCGTSAAGASVRRQQRGMSSHPAAKQAWSLTWKTKKAQSSVHIVVNSSYSCSGEKSSAVGGTPAGRGCRRWRWQPLRRPAPDLPARTWCRARQLRASAVGESRGHGDAREPSPNKLQQQVRRKKLLYVRHEQPRARPGDREERQALAPRQRPPPCRTARPLRRRAPRLTVSQLAHHGGRLASIPVARAGLPQATHDAAHPVSVCAASVATSVPTQQTRQAGHPEHAGRCALPAQSAGDCVGVPASIHPQDPVQMLG